MNNRQNGRRRGRGGQQVRNGQPQGNGSRVDNRARGNAPQLYEKYKALARDAQMQGDRVNTEYYLQFADHYFRVLSESRSRYEEQRRPREDYGQDYAGDGDGDQGPRGYQAGDDAEDGWDDGDEERGDQRADGGQQDRYQPPRGQGDRPQGQPERQPYQGRSNGNGQGSAGQGSGARANGSNGGGRGQASGSDGGRPGNGTDAAAARAPFVPAAEVPETVPARIDLDRMPPSIAAPAGEMTLGLEGEPSDDGAPVAPKRRRTRKPKADAAPAIEA